MRDGGRERAGRREKRGVPSFPSRAVRVCPRAKSDQRVEGVEGWGRNKKGATREKQGGRREKGEEE